MSDDRVTIAWGTDPPSEVTGLDRKAWIEWLDSNPEVRASEIAELAAEYAEGDSDDDDSFDEYGPFQVGS
jgi:hypothetical protein